MRMFLFSTFLVASSLLFGCATAPSAATAIAEIERAGDQLWDAHERGDAAGMAKLVTDDAILMVPGFPDIRGRDAIRAAAEGMFKMLRISDFTVKKREIRVNGDEAFEIAWYSETLHSGQADPKAVDGRYLIVWKREPTGAWRVHRNLYNLATAPQM